MRALNRLTAKTVENITADGRYCDGGNLYLRINNGGKSWVFMYRDRVTGRLREMGMGPTFVVSLADARRKAAEARKLLWDAKDPLAEKRAQKAAAQRAKTFGEFADEFVEKVLPSFRNDKHQYQWRQTLTAYAAPLRSMLLQDITTEDVRKMLEPIWHTKHETARRLRGRIERIFAAAKASGLREGENPATWKGNLEPHFGKQKRIKQHRPAIPYNEMPAFMAELRRRSSVSAHALEFTILTTARTGETLGTRLSEIDFDEKVWTVPAERMKSGRLHRVPLTDRAITLLRSLKVFKPNGYVFAGARGKPLSNWAMLECLRDLREGVTVHGFRSSFRDWAGDETSFPREVAEAALAHAIQDETEAAYRRSDALNRRRELMELWARFLAGDTGNVVVITGKRKAS